MSDPTPVLEVESISKRYGAVRALEDVTLRVYAGKVTCLLGDNGAGKSTLIKILSGVVQPDAGTMRVDGAPVRFRSATDALDAGIATVFQELSVVPIMSVFRNFFLRREPTRGRGPFLRFDIGTAERIATEQLRRIGIDLTDPNRPIATLSGGERQCVAIARAIYFGARVLILDEPTSALGVKEAAIVLRYVRDARRNGIGVVFITHNAHHAFPAGDSFVILKRGTMLGTFPKEELSIETLTNLMAGGEEVAQLDEELTTRESVELLHEADSRVVAGQ